MAKISRADWAATTPWLGITDKPDSFGVTDIGELTGLGYSNGQVPVYNRSLGRFRPGNFPTPAPTPPAPTPISSTEIWVVWDPPNLHALQSCYEDFDSLIGAFVSQPVMVGCPFDDAFVMVSASIIATNTARITVQNLGLDDLDLAEGTWRLRIFNG